MHMSTYTQGMVTHNINVCACVHAQTHKYRQTHTQIRTHRHKDRDECSKQENILTLRA